MWTAFTASCDASDFANTLQPLSTPILERRHTAIPCRPEALLCYQPAFQQSSQSYTPEDLNEDGNLALQRMENSIIHS